MNKYKDEVIKLNPSVFEYLSLSGRLLAYKSAPVSRDELERKLARYILIIDRKYLAILEANNGVIPMNYWANYEAELRLQIASPLRSQIEQSFSNYSDYVDFIDKAGAISDIDTAMTRAIDEVARGITETSRLKYQALLQQGVTPEEIIERMALRFSSGHAEQVAVTELTRAEAHFSDALQSRLTEQGVTSQIRWQTSEDEKVCPICAPADHRLKDEPITAEMARRANGGRGTGGWNGQSWGSRFSRPPAHPRCKCASVVEIVRGKSVSMKGGEGSGNFGHAGRPGLVGGSADENGKIVYNNGMPYYRWTNSGERVMSDWGHAMFMDKYNPEAAQGYGRYSWEFDPAQGKTTSFEEIKKDFSDYMQQYFEMGYYPEDIDGWFESWIVGVEEGTFTFEEIINGFNPDDIIDSAGAYDNPIGVGVMYDFLSNRGIGAIVTNDGAIVYDENMIVRRGDLDR